MNLVRIACVLPLLAACHSARANDTAPEPAGSASSSRHASSGATAATVGTDPGHVGQGTPLTPVGRDRLAAFAAGCFWGVEDAFRHVPGVVATAVGYAGGRTTDPTYASVSSHATGHAESVLIEYDPTRLSYDQLLHVFWSIHDPTQVDGQGPDIGSNYRSIIFTFDGEQAAAARASRQAAQKSLEQPITTEIRPIGAFYKAEGYHQQYAERTGHHGCPIHIAVDKL
ncbi:MAG TPA: peptide-methionine (S)-S-oxide reductase MsrA [Polyangiaceae bacterium]|nr:peptide-methionine (S)-S-oxide reductase MsrA [Polyangiaceae bacterium]